MDGEPRYRIMRVHEDADEDGVLRVPEPDDCDPGEAPETEPELIELRYADQHPWRCGDCNQPVLPGWARCPVCGRFREDCEA